MYDYHAAFSRNLGWVTEAEQAILRSKRVAIAGMGIACEDLNADGRLTVFLPSPR